MKVLSVLAAVAFALAISTSGVHAQAGGGRKGVGAKCPFPSYKQCVNVCRKKSGGAGADAGRCNQRCSNMGCS
jgi:hypothetical protein